MIKRLRENEHLRNKNYFKVRNNYRYKYKAAHIDFQTATKEQRDQIRREIAREARADR